LLRCFPPFAFIIACCHATVNALDAGRFCRQSSSTAATAATTAAAATTLVELTVVDLRRKRQQQHHHQHTSGCYTIV